ncbi:MAG: HEAT repeat domain-containing protein, partial [Chloroflexi bacterium]|nr:HEAT repeat domain-containing protein [Chloroflexota bacterium]
MPRQAFDRKIDALEALRRAPDLEATRRQLRAALKERNNFLVARAAAITAELHLDDLVPDLLTAYDRFFVDQARSDPQCLAKHALARALHELGHHGAHAYVRGITHVQLEPGWGGRTDTAASLRGTCARALTDCFLDDLETLRYLTDALADPDATVRVDAAIAIDQLNRPEGALLLRLKLLVGDAAPEVMGQCCTSLLSLAPEGAVDFVSRFLRHANVDVQVEAASALAQCRDAQAITLLREFWRDDLVPIDVRRAILIGLGASPLPE